MILLGSANGRAECDFPGRRLCCMSHCKHVHAALAAPEWGEAEAKMPASLRPSCR